MLLGGCRGCRIRRLSGSDLVVVGYCYYHRKAWWIFGSRERLQLSIDKRFLAFASWVLCFALCFCLEILLVVGVGDMSQ